MDHAASTAHSDAAAAAAHTSSRHSRSPLRFARLRQTRVASISPTPTLVGGSGGGGGARNGHSPPGAARASSGSRGPTSRRRRDASTARFSVTTATDEREQDEAVDAKPIDGEQRDLEKGVVAPSAAPPAPPPQAPPPPAEAPRPSTLERLLPHPIPHFLGKRRPAHQLAPHLRDVKPHASIIPSIVHRIPPPLEAILWAMIGAFVGIAIVLLTFGRPRHFTSSVDVPPHAWAAPIIVGSFGASSVLLYAAPASPLGQPRCFVGGQTLSALVGVAVTKLLRLAGPAAYDLQHTDNSASVVWVAGALATACALAIMTVTGTLHPPGGATAVLCATNAEVSRMGWKIIPVVLLSSMLMLAWSLLWMNLGRKRYPESFVAAAPVAYKDGNLLQGAVDWINKHRSKQASSSGSQPSQTTTSNSATPPNKPTTTTTLPKRTDSHSRDAHNPWLDETDWRQANATLAEDAHEDDAADLPVERPSRWASTITRSAH